MCTASPLLRMCWFCCIFTMSYFNQQRARMYVCYIKEDLQRDNKIQEILYVGSISFLSILSLVPLYFPSFFCFSSILNACLVWVNV